MHCRRALRSGWRESDEWTSNSNPEDCTNDVIKAGAGFWPFWLLAGKTYKTAHCLEVALLLGGGESVARAKSVQVAAKANHGMTHKSTRIEGLVHTV